MIVAVSNNFGIGYKGDLLFRNKTDLMRFQELTMDNFIVMGRKTYESLPKYLEGRTHVVLTRDKKYKPKDSRVIVEHDVGKIINYYLNTGEQEKDLWVIGGAEIYKAFLPYVEEVHLTMIHKSANNVDTYFPMEDVLNNFTIKESEEECELTFTIYERNKITHSI